MRCFEIPFDGTRAPGAYVMFEHLTIVDEHFDPKDYLFQDEDYRAEDQARLDTFNQGYWHGIGTVARAHISVVKNGYQTHYTMDSAGLWGTESDSDDTYLASIFEDEKETLTEDIATLGTVTFL